MKTLKSRFARRLASYIRLRRGLGFKLEAQAEVLRRFDAYVQRRRYRGPLTQALALAFATKDQTVSRTECWRRYQFVRHFAEYLTAFEPHMAPLDPKALRRGTDRPSVHVYTDAELARLLREASAISPSYPFRGITLHAMIGLAASTGLRLGEVVRLDKDDVDLDRGVLAIRRTKFRKDRLVPMHPTVVAVLRRYAVAREAVSCGDSSAFFLSLLKQRFARNTVDGAFRIVAERAGLRGPTDRAGPFGSLIPAQLDQPFQSDWIARSGRLDH
jgi:integrase